MTAITMNLILIHEGIDPRFDFLNNGSNNNEFDPHTWKLREKTTTNDNDNDSIKNHHQIKRNHEN